MMYPAYYSQSVLVFLTIVLCMRGAGEWGLTVTRTLNMNPETLEALLKVLNEYPTNRKNAVVVSVVMYVNKKNVK